MVADVVKSLSDIFWTRPYVLAPNHNFKGKSPSDAYDIFDKSIVYRNCVNLTIHVFAWKRQLSLERLLRSILKIGMTNCRIPLIIHIDGDACPLVINSAESFVWKYGPKTVDIKETHLGLPDCILKSWVPESDDEWGIFLEDDLEVSPFYMEWVRFCINNTKEFQKVVGCSFYTPRVDEISPTSDPENPKLWNPHMVTKSPVFLFQLPSSWGAVYKASHWKKFLEFYEWRKELEFPALHEGRSNLWSLSWKRHFIDYIYYNKLFVLYPNFPNQESFSTNYYEEGVHSFQEGHEIKVMNYLRDILDTRFTVPLIQTYFHSNKFIEITKLEDLPAISLQHELLLTINE